MKFLMPFVLFLILALFGFAQTTENIDLDNDYFLVGTLSDYMGREKYSKIENRVDKYYQSEKTLYFAIDSIFKETYPDLKLSTEKNETVMEDVFQLHSESLAQQIELFYYYKPSGTGTYRGELNFKELNLDSLFNTTDFYTEYYDTIYTGRLKPDMFETERQKLSFITGAFVRFGGSNDSTYYIRVPNSVSKVKVLEQLLIETGCTKVAYIIKKYIPVQHIVNFTPTEKLKSYFMKYSNFK